MIHILKHPKQYKIQKKRKTKPTQITLNIKQTTKNKYSKFQKQKKNYFFTKNKNHIIF